MSIYYGYQIFRERFGRVVVGSLRDDEVRFSKLSNKNIKLRGRLQMIDGSAVLTVSDRDEEDEQTKTVLITSDFMYEEPVSTFEHSDISQVKINYNKLKPLGKTDIFGWQPGWLGLYIIFSIVFSMGLRRFMKIH